MKKGFVSVLALILALSLAVPALAVEDGAEALLESPEQTEQSAETALTEELLVGDDAGLKNDPTNEDGSFGTDDPTNENDHYTTDEPVNRDDNLRTDEPTNEDDNRWADGSENEDYGTDGPDNEDDIDNSDFGLTEPQFDAENYELPDTFAEDALLAEEPAVLHVTVPQSGRIVINPYNLPVELSDGTSTDQIAGEVLPIVNNSEFPVQVSASVVGQVSEESSLTYVNQPPLADSTQKEIFLYAEFQQGDGLWLDGYEGAANQMLVSQQISGPQDVLTLPSGPSEGVFRLFGAVTKFPDEPWDAVDEITVTVMFTFTALEEDGNAIATAEPAAGKTLMQPPMFEGAEDFPEEEVQTPYFPPQETPADETEEIPDLPVDVPEEEPVKDTDSEEVLPVLPPASTDGWLVGLGLQPAADDFTEGIFYEPLE